LLKEVISSQYAKNVLQREITADSERPQREDSREPRETVRRDFREKTPERGFRERSLVIT
jgi:hypothetical protein